MTSEMAKISLFPPIFFHLTMKTSLGVGRKYLRNPWERALWISQLLLIRGAGEEKGPRSHIFNKKSNFDSSKGETTAVPFGPSGFGAVSLEIESFGVFFLVFLSQTCWVCSRSWCLWGVFWVVAPKKGGRERCTSCCSLQMMTGQKWSLCKPQGQAGNAKN